ncbi:MAG: hypothetical protein WA192_12065 [Candidatus Acidiferrales bacterium]
MSPKTNRIELSVLCAIVIVLSVWGIVWDITSGLLTSGIDGIMLLAICLMIGGIFSLALLYMLWQAGFIPIFKATKSPAPVQAATAQKSASPAPPAPAAK